ncbi:MAG: hypothetical protein ABFS35_02680 [Bacteroidota bacterium]
MEEAETLQEDTILFKLNKKQDAKLRKYFSEIEGDIYFAYYNSDHNFIEIEFHVYPKTYFSSPVNSTKYIILSTGKKIMVVSPDLIINSMNIGIMGGGYYIKVAMSDSTVIEDIGFQ